ncbi:MAG TPA: MJ0042-type zinc finger domain-containing protein, partial [Burkholderiaceae bacterium]|nr:MJ0042-type zinc finger domain-containing protein [Burkholderiaceae bacterium]
MALATTCPQCKTSFKVVPDQLKLRRGLVRCGVCQHVFSGIDYLRYVDDANRAATGASRSAPPRTAAGADAAAHPGTSPQTVIADDNLKTAFFLTDNP